MNTKRPVVLAIVTVALLGFTFSRALAKEVVGATLAGPGLAGEIQISEPGDLEVVSAPWFDLLATGQPADLQNDGYYTLRLEIGTPEQIEGANVFHYFPGASGQPGYFFFADCQGCSGSFEAWYRISDQEDLALRQLLVSLGAPAELTGAAERSLFGLESLSRSGILLSIALLALVSISVVAFAFLRGRPNKTVIEG